MNITGEINFWLVFFRSIMYPIAAFFMLVLSFSANRQSRVQLFWTHILIAVLFMVLGLMAVVRIVYDDNLIISNIGNYAITPLLFVLCYKLAYHSIAEERNYILRNKEKTHDKPC